MGIFDMHVLRDEVQYFQETGSLRPASEWHDIDEVTTMTDKHEGPCEDVLEGDEPDALETLADYTVDETNMKDASLDVSKLEAEVLADLEEKKA